MVCGREKNSKQTGALMGISWNAETPEWRGQVLAQEEGFALISRYPVFETRCTHGGRRHVGSW